jgi:hypothetical protein
MAASVRTVTVIGRLSLSSSSLTTELPPAGEPVRRSAVLRAMVRSARRDILAGVDAASQVGGCPDLPHRTTPCAPIYHVVPCPWQVKLRRRRMLCHREVPVRAIKRSTRKLSNVKHDAHRKSI